MAAPPAVDGSNEAHPDNSKALAVVTPLDDPRDDDQASPAQGRQQGNDDLDVQGMDKAESFRSNSPNSKFTDVPAGSRSQGPMGGGFRPDVVGPLVAAASDQFARKSIQISCWNQ